MCKNTPTQSYIKNPNQMEMEGFDTGFPEVYAEGFNSGINWDANWMPGGPWVYRGTDKNLRESSEASFKRWHDGFQDGLKLRLETNAHFAEWWNRNRGKRIGVDGATIEDVRYRPEPVE